MEERPILYNTAMTRAVLEGRKTQTRRIMKPQPEHRENENLPGSYGSFFHHWNLEHELFSVDNIIKYCPYGKPGDRLWVRETHYLYGKWVKNGLSKTGRQKFKFKALKKEAKYFNCPPDKIVTKKNETGWFKRPSIFMPKWALRITLEITDIRAERVRGITTNGIQAEGVKLNKGPGGVFYAESAYNAFEELWNSINEKRGYSWESNPFVWVIEFKKIKPEDKNE